MRREIVYVGTHADCLRASESLSFPAIVPASVVRVANTDAWQLRVGEEVAGEARRAVRALFPIVLTIDRGGEGDPLTLSSADIVSAEIRDGWLTARLRNGRALSAQIALADVAAVERWIEAAP